MNVRATVKENTICISSLNHTKFYFPAQKTYNRRIIFFLIQTTVFNVETIRSIFLPLILLNGRLLTIKKVVHYRATPAL